MRILFDITLLVLTTYITINSFRLISSCKSASLSDFCILLLYFFQCLPVLADYVLGRPEYRAWYSDFRLAIDHDGVSIVYDIYIIFLFLALYYASKKAEGVKRTVFDDRSTINKIPDSILWLFVILPFLFVIVSGNFRQYIIYASSGARGIEPSFSGIVANLLIISIISAFLLYFRKSPRYYRYILMAMYCFFAIWLSGKRYIVATILFCFFYMYTLHRDKRKSKMNMKIVILVMVLGLILYSLYYIMNIKITTDGSWQQTYSMLRIDFGRDDVVKFTILREFFQGQHILDYPAETVISTILMIIPRSVFPEKPYPHYRYLTASLFHTTIDRIPSGMTPSVLEMMISNFYWIGLPIAIWFLCWYCKKADSARSTGRKFIFAVVLMGLLTQSMDSMLFVFYILIWVLITNRIRFTFSGTRIRFVDNNNKNIRHFN